jgi:hypothetical protein
MNIEKLFVELSNPLCREAILDWVVGLRFTEVQQYWTNRCADSS